jgi:hypothetical protein
MATENSIYRIHPEVLSDQNPQPAGDVGVGGPQNSAVQVTPPAEFTQVGGFDASEILKIWVVVLAGKTGSVRAKMPIDSDAVGVQFWGNEWSGWAQIKVDGIIRWVGDTYNLRSYVEIYDLSPGTHIVTVEALGQVGEAKGSGEVRVAAFGYGLVGSKKHKVFLPISMK